MLAKRDDLATQRKKTLFNGAFADDLAGLVDRRRARTLVVSLSLGP
jgi:hypothetical protein